MPKTLNKKLIKYSIISISGVFLLVGTLLIVNNSKKKIFCIGDSITYGLGVSKTRDKQSYPAYLQNLLGKRYVVENYGKSGATALIKSNKPYIEQEEYKQSLAESANIYIIMFGTNDSRPMNWSDTDNGKKFERDYINLIKSYQAKSKNCKFLLMQPTRSFMSMTPMTEKTPDDNLIRTTIADYIKAIGKKLKIPVINLYNLTKDHPEWFPDDLHPNAYGNKKIAQYIYEQGKSYAKLW